MVQGVRPDSVHDRLSTNHVHQSFTAPGSDEHFHKCPGHCIESINEVDQRSDLFFHQSSGQIFLGTVKMLRVIVDKKTPHIRFGASQTGISGGAKRDLSLIFQK